MKTQKIPLAVLIPSSIPQKHPLDLQREFDLSLNELATCLSVPISTVKAWSSGKRSPSESQKVWVAIRYKQIRDYLVSQQVTLSSSKTT